MPGPEQAEFLFVYGTLKRGLDNPWSRRLWSEAEVMGEATVSGRLYSLGGYPGLKDPTGRQAERVHGEVARLPEGRALLDDLDAYEGDEYKRVVRIATLPDGEQISVWVYMYQPEVTEKQRIVSGYFAFGQ